MTLRQFQSQPPIVTATNETLFLTCMSSSPIHPDLIETNRSLFSTGYHHPLSSIIAIASNPDHIIHLYYQNGNDNTLSFYGELIGHTAPIHEVRFANPLEHPNILLSTAEDGNILVWDIRTRQNIMKFQPKDRNGNAVQIFTCDIRGNMIVAGGENGSIYFYDIRSNELLAHSNIVHEGDVTQVRFHPTQPNFLFSGSEDGLINVYDLNNTLQDFENSIDNVLSTQQTVAKFGFLGPDSEFLWCISAIESLSLWNINENQRMVNYTRDQFNQILVNALDFNHKKFFHIVDDTDDINAHVINMSPLGPTTTYDWRIDNLLSCNYDSNNDILYALAGTIGGGVAIFTIKDNILALYALLPPNTCHKRRIRDYIWQSSSLISNQGDVLSLITCSQDSRIGQWSSFPKAL